MGLGINIVIIGVVLVFLVMMQQQGWDGIKANPLDSGIQATQTIGGTSKDVFDKGMEIIDNIKSNGTTAGNSGTLEEIGQIPCSNDNQCNELLEVCQNNCSCIGGSCFR